MMHIMRSLLWLARIGLFSGVTLFIQGFIQAFAQAPAVNTGGTVDAASFTQPVAPGSLISIFGSNLAVSTQVAPSVPLPLTLGGASVTVNNVPAYLVYVSPLQINAQLPWETPTGGAVNVVVTVNGVASAPQPVSVAEFAPALYEVGGQALAANLNGTPVSSQPVTPGDTLVLYASGLGYVSPPGVDGNNSLDLLRSAMTVPAVTIGGIPARVEFAGLSPQFVGVYQLNVVAPPGLAPSAAAPVSIQTGGASSTVTTAIAVGAGWPQWSQNSGHDSSLGVAGQSLTSILVNIVYDPLVSTEQSEGYGDLTVHYQVPLVDGGDVYMEFKSGTYSTTTYSTVNWGENKFTWQGNQLTPVWTYTSDWKPPGSQNDFWEPVFHPALANDSVYLPGASGSLIQLRKDTGAVIQRIAPFGTDPNTYETGPLAVDVQGNLYYNVIQVVVNPSSGFYATDSLGSWLVQVTPTGAFSMASYPSITSPDAPSPTSLCLTTFSDAQLPWPPSPTAVPPSSPCGSQRTGMNIAPAIGPDGTIYSVTTAHFNGSYGYLVALNPDLSRKWVASLANRFDDGCGVAVSAGGWLPPNGQPGGCNAGAPLGVDPSTNQPGSGYVNDSSSASPTVAPDGSVLYGAYSRYNYAQGHMMHFDASGNYLQAYGFGWDITPGIYVSGSNWSAVIKENHYNYVGSYCNDAAYCPVDRDATNPASPEAYYITQLSPAMTAQWQFQNTNTESCSRNADGSLTCTSTNPNGFEWCVNAPAIDSNGVVYANSEDGNLYAIGQGGGMLAKIFQQLALGAAYTPASIGGDGRIYTQNDGHLFVVGN